MEFGAEAKDIIASAKATNRPVPEELANPPVLDEGLGLFYMAFTDLHSCRSDYGIPYTAIIVWMDENEISGPQRDRGIYFLHEMDSAYAGHVDKERKKERALAKSRAKR